MKPVQRYGVSSMPCDNGCYVKFSEYEAVEAECARLRAENDSLLCGLADCREACFDKEDLHGDEYLAGAVGDPMDVSFYVDAVSKGLRAEVRRLREDAERWRDVVRWTVENDGPSGEGFEFSYQPSGYNGGHFCWIEFGWRQPQWQHPTAEQMNAAIDAARAKTADLLPVDPKEAGCFPEWSTAEVDGWKADAERYRYLRNISRRSCLTLKGPDAGCWIDSENEDGSLVLLTEKDADIAIDAARAKEKA